MAYTGVPVPERVRQYVDDELIPRCRRYAQEGRAIVDSGDPDYTLCVLGLPARTRKVAEPEWIPLLEPKRRRKRKSNDSQVIGRLKNAS